MTCSWQDEMELCVGKCERIEKWDIIWRKEKIAHTRTLGYTREKYTIKKVQNRKTSSISCSAKRTRARVTHFDPKLCVFRCPSENFDCPLLLLLLLLLTRIELDLAGDTFKEAMPDSKLQKLFAAFVIVVDTSRLFCDACFFCCWCFGGGSSFSDFLKME